MMSIGFEGNSLLNILIDNSIIPDDEEYDKHHENMPI